MKGRESGERIKNEKKELWAVSCLRLVRLWLLSNFCKWLCVKPQHQTWNLVASCRKGSTKYGVNDTIITWRWILIINLRWLLNYGCSLNGEWVNSSNHFHLLFRISFVTERKWRNASTNLKKGLYSVSWLYLLLLAQFYLLIIRITVNGEWWMIIFPIHFFFHLNKN